MNDESSLRDPPGRKKINESQKRDVILNYSGPFKVTCNLNM